MNPLFIYYIAKDNYIVLDLFQDPPEGATLVASIDPKEWLQSYLNASLKKRAEMLREIEL